MPTFSAAYASANNPYNIFNVISGQQTTGVTKRTGVSTQPAASRNWSRLSIMIDDSIAGNIYLTSGGPPASATNLVGEKIPSGDSKLLAGEGNMRAISLADKSFAVDTTGMILHITYE